MSAGQNQRHIEVMDAGRAVASADVEGLAGPTEVRASLHVESGHLPVGARSRLVDAVLDLPELGHGQRLHATIPMGDAEILERVYDRCEHVETRPAGATCLVDADVRTA